MRRNKDFEIWVKMQNWLDILSDITGGLSKAEFCNNLEKQLAAAMAVNVVGELCYKLTDHGKEKLSLSARALYNFRNLLAHDYDNSILPDLLWDFINSKTPVLREDIQKVLVSIKEENE